MATGNRDLIELMRAEIEKRGPQSFAWFMQQALYHIDHGYYSSGRCAIGRRGDYFTSVSVGPLFGQLLATQFVEIWERLGKPGRGGGVGTFVIVEQGAHDGRFAHDVLHWAQKRAPEFFAALRYRILEPFPFLQKQQAGRLRSFRDKVEWCDSLKPFTGVHFSNELLDAMPVRLIANNKESLVGLDGDRFVFVERESGDQTFNGAVLTWVDEVAANLERGYVVAIDYGHFENEFRGSIQVRARHRNLDSPFEKIGEADITMPVDWRSIVDCAQTSGLRVAGFTDQHHFLTGIISTWPNLIEDRSPNSSVFGGKVQDRAADRKIKRALQTLLHPEMLGRAFQVLVLEKKIDSSTPPLAGFKFAREANQTAGI